MSRIATIMTALVVTVASGWAALAVAPDGGAAGSVQGSPVGWRTDGTGRYPSADPPIKWSATEAVVWKAAMPSWSNGSPCVIADRIFVTSEPVKDPKNPQAPAGPFLICVNKADGKVLWTKSNGYADIMIDAERQQVAADKAKADQIRKEELDPPQKELNSLGQEIKKLAQNKTPTDAEKRQLADLKAKTGPLQTKVTEANAQLAPLLKWEMPPTQGSNGHSSATPVSDGKFVYVVYNTGVVACYDLDGNRKWARKINERCPDNYGFCSSPVLADNKVIVHLKTAIALDAATGKDAWQCQEAKWSWASPLVVTVSKTAALVTGNGDIIRLADGKLLAGNLCRLVYNSPIVAEGTAYFIQNTEGKAGAAFKLVAKGDDGVAAEPLWKTDPKLKSDRYYGSPLLHDGLIYAITQANWLSVIDAGNGKVVADKKLDLGKMTEYPSTCLAGKYVFASNADGTTVVLEPGKELKEVGRNQLSDEPGNESFRSCPVFEGKRMYIRARKNLYCIGQ